MIRRRDLQDQISNANSSIIAISDKAYNIEHSMINSRLLTREELDKISKKQDERWEMLKNYLGVKEEEYAELEIGKTLSICGKQIDTEKKPVKKTKLVKIKKSNK